VADEDSSFGRQSIRATRLQRWLTYERLPVVLAILAVGLTLPSMLAGWVADDYHHRLRMVGSPAFEELSHSPMDLFAFADGDPEHNRKLMDIGFWPWWTLPDLLAAFMRPVTAVTHWVDYQLWPKLPSLMHAQSLLWFAGLIIATTVFYRRIIGLTWLAGLAALLYAIDDARAMPAGWLANRNAVIAAFFGVLTLIAHDGWRRRNWRMGAVAGPLLLAASLLAKEEGIATCAYLFAYALFLDRGALRGRIVALLPYVAVVLAWRIVWTHLGYGVYGIEIYVDPVTEPLRYAAAVLSQAPVLLLGQFFFPPSELYMFSMDLGVHQLYTVVSIVVVGLFAAIMIPRLVWEKTTRFWALGMMLSLLPICATFPADRGLSFAGLGACALLAQFLGVVFGSSWKVLRSGLTRPRAVATRALGVAFIVIHLCVAPLLLVVRAAVPVAPVSLLERLQVNVPMGPEVKRQSVVIVTAPMPILAGYLPARRALDGLPVPAHTRILAPSDSESVTVSRPDERTLVVRPAHGYLALAADRLARDLLHPMSLGERVELTGMTVEVTALMPDGRPAEAAFTFDVPLEDDSLRWLAWGNPSYVPFTPPAIGETIKLPIARPENDD